MSEPLVVVDEPAPFVRRLTLNPMRTDVVGGPIGVLHSPGGAIHSMEVGPSGSIYFSDRNGVYRLVRR